MNVLRHGHVTDSTCLLPLRMEVSSRDLLSQKIHLLCKKKNTLKDGSEVCKPIGRHTRYRGVRSVPERWHSNWWCRRCSNEHMDNQPAFFPADVERKEEHFLGRKEQHSTRGAGVWHPRRIFWIFHLPSLESDGNLVEGQVCWRFWHPPCR